MEKNDWVLIADDLSSGVVSIEEETSKNSKEKDDLEKTSTNSDESTVESSLAMPFLSAITAKAESLSTQTVHSLSKASYFSNIPPISEPLRDFTKSAANLSHNWWSMAVFEANGIINSISEDLADLLPSLETSDTLANDVRNEEDYSLVLMEGLKSKGSERFDGRNFKEWFANVETIFIEVLSNDPQRLLTGLKLCSTPEIAALIDEVSLPTNDWNTLVDRLSKYFAKRESTIKKYEALNDHTNI